MRNSKKRLLCAVMAFVLLLSLSVSAFAAEETDTQQNQYPVTLRLLSEEEALISPVSDDYTLRQSTVLLKPNNSTGSNGTKITSFTAEHETAIFKLTVAANTSTYNVVCLDSEGNEVSEYYKDIPLNNPVAADGLVIGEKYTFRVSSNDCPKRCTASYELQY